MTGALWATGAGKTPPSFRCTVHVLCVASTGVTPVTSIRSVSMTIGNGGLGRADEPGESLRTLEDPVTADDRGGDGGVTVSRHVNVLGERDVSTAELPE